MPWTVDIANRGDNLMPDRAIERLGTDLLDRVVSCFHSLFLIPFETELCNHGVEPLYVPRSASYPRHRIYFAHGFWSSALHEIAHWCIAGPQRRRQLDYGYWYKPDGRNGAEQAQFQLVEVKPQALEWLFTSAIGQPFYVSFDNLSGASPMTVEQLAFRRRLRVQALSYLENGLPKRAGQFLQRLLLVFRTELIWRQYWSEVRWSGVLPD